MGRFETSGSDRSVSPGIPPRVFTKRGQGKADAQYYDRLEKSRYKVPRIGATGLRAMRGASDEESELDTTSKASDTSDSDAGDDYPSDSSGNPSSDDGERVKVSGLPGSDEEISAPGGEVAQVSFGALAKAQETLGKRKRRDHSYSDPDDHPRHGKRTHENIDSEALERKAGKKDFRDFSRSSKHAPAEFSSKKAVSRKRDVVPTHKLDIRDPRFEPVSGIADEQKTKKNYSFLDAYRESEIAELKSTIRKTRNPDAKEKLKRALLSMESRKKTQEAKDQQQDILRRHRKEEKEKIEQGKKPYYLKKAEQKKMALVERFEGMKKKQVNKVIEKRRKKATAKERRGMPDARRG